LYNCNIDKKQKHSTQKRRIITADVDLTDIISRDEFVLFLQRIVVGLQKMTLTNNDHHGGDFCDPRFYGDGSQIENYINKLERILEFINQYGLQTDPDWKNFTIDVSLWGNLELVKLIPYLFSTAFDGLNEFTGSYFAANSDARTKFFGEVEDTDKFAFLISSMEHRTNFVLYIEPQSLKLKYLKQVLEEPKMVFWRNHFFPILSERDEVYKELRDAKAKAAATELKNAELEKELQRYRNTTAV